MDAPHYEPMADDFEEDDTRLPLSDEERRALELYDKLQELRLEIAIINAQQSHQSGKPITRPKGFTLPFLHWVRHSRGDDARGDHSGA